MNLAALRSIYPDVDLSAAEVNRAAGEELSMRLPDTRVEIDLMCPRGASRPQCVSNLSRDLADCDQAAHVVRGLNLSRWL